MLKFLGLLVLLTATFATGFYLGRHSIGELTKTVSRNRDGPLTECGGHNRESRAHVERRVQDLVDVKSQVIQAKSDVLNRNFGSASKILNEAVTNLERTKQIEKSAERTAKINGLIKNRRRPTRHHRRKAKFPGSTG